MNLITGQGNALDRHAALHTHVPFVVTKGMGKSTALESNG